MKSAAYSDAPGHHFGQHVERLDFDKRKAFVKAVDVDYYTDAIRYMQVRVLKVAQEEMIAGPAARAHGDVLVRLQDVGSKKIKFFTNENVGSGKLELPENEMHTTSFWLTLGHWVATGSLNFPRVGHTATLLANGEVLVAGGQDTSSNLIGAAELYNPTTGKWTVTGSLANGRFDHTATLLANGEVLIAGGVSGTYTAAAELYNPSTGIWTSAGNMTVPMAFAAAALLPNRKVLVAGGSNSWTDHRARRSRSPANCGRWACWS